MLWRLAVLPGSVWRLRGAAPGHRKAICAFDRNEGEQGTRCHSASGVKGRGTCCARVSCGEDHTCLGPTCACLSFHTPQMRCLTMPVLLRALAQAQAARAGRTKGTFPGCGGPASWHEVTSARCNPSPCRACQWPGPPQQRSGSHLQVCEPAGALDGHEVGDRQGSTDPAVDRAHPRWARGTGGLRWAPGG